jgi:pilus assembly protein CpaF
VERFTVNSVSHLKQMPIELKSLLENPFVTDICLNGCKSLYFDSGNGMEEGRVLSWTEIEMKKWVLDQLSLAGKTWDARHPFADATISTGHRLHATFPPLCSTGMLLSFRRIPQMQKAIQRPKEETFWIEQGPYALLKEIVSKGESLLIAGSTGAGKTTLLNTLLSEIPFTKRIIALEDTPELAPRHPHFLSLVSRASNADGFGEVGLRELLKQSLRMRPDRIILGECRGDEVMELLQTLNTGHQGAMATIHANSCRDALYRIELLCLLAAKGQISSKLMRELLALTLKWIVHVKRDGPQRVIHEISRVEGREGDTILLRPMLKLSQ